MRPPWRYAFDAWIFGTICATNALALVSPPAPGVAPSAPGPLHGESWPSSQRFGVMKFQVATWLLARSVASCVNGTTCAAHGLVAAPLGVSISEWKYTNGLWRAAY